MSNNHFGTFAIVERGTVQVGDGVGVHVTNGAGAIVRDMTFVGNGSGTGVLIDGGRPQPSGFATGLASGVAAAGVSKLFGW